MKIIRLLFVSIFIFLSTKNLRAESEIKLIDTTIKTDKIYRIPTSISIDLYKSQDALTDYSLGIINLWKNFDDKFENIDIFCYLNSLLVRPFIAFQIALWTHEIFGHSVRAAQFGVSTTGFSMMGPFGAATHLRFKNNYLQEAAAVSLGGNEATHDLAEKLKDQILNTEMNPFYGLAYNFSQGNQIAYIYFIYNNYPGHDINSYINYMQIIYGEGYITGEKIRMAGILDYLDPFFAYSIYAHLLNKKFSVPMISIKSVKFLPAARLHLTPYGIEKQIILHLKLSDTLIKLTGNFGETRLLKANEKLIRTRKNNPNIKVYDNYDSITENVRTFGLAIESKKITSINNFDLGTSLAIWRQPDIFRKNENDVMINPLLAKMQIGGLALVNCNYVISSMIDAEISAGYKTNGYTHGYPVNNGMILKLSLIWKV